MTYTTDLSFALLILSELCFLTFCYRRGLVYLRFFQQEEYNTPRFLRWMSENLAIDKRGSALLLTVMMLSFVSSSVPLLFLIAAAGFVFLTFSQPDPRKSGKIKLNMTARASRIFLVAAVLFLLIYLLTLCFCPVSISISERNLPYYALLKILFIQVLPLMLPLANYALSPLEKATKQRYKNEAIQLLQKYNPLVIGITGSYGKTSVKAALGEVLNTILAPTFCPPKSINTEMGITREIRENLKPGHKFAVIEMGAYNVGSIKRLCNLTPPKAGLVTVVGMAHLERYGSVERIYHAKSELPQAVPDDGILVCNGDNEGSRRMTVEFPKKTTLLYGMKPELGKLDCLADNIRFTVNGTDFDLHWKGNKYAGFTRLLGLPALSNLLGVFTMACALGADPEFVLATIRNIPPVDNRLSVSKEGEVLFLRDAYNSNPLGFEAALEVMKQLPGERKILMTPGMIELGHEQFNQNKIAGTKAAGVCDLVILVGETNRAALKEGLLAGGFSEEAVICCQSRDEAFSRLNQILSKGDIVLLENDLPDLYEVREKF